MTLEELDNAAMKFLAEQTEKMEPLHPIACVILMGAGKGKFKIAGNCPEWLAAQLIKAAMDQAGLIVAEAVPENPQN